MIESGKYDFDIYNHKPNQEHYFIVIIKKSLNTNELRFKLKLQAEQFTDQKSFDIEHVDFSNNLALITIKTFDNYQESELFYKSILNSEIFYGYDADEYNNYFISKSNYNIFLKDKMIEKYDMFFKKQYSISIQ